MGLVSNATAAYPERPIEMVVPFAVTFTAELLAELKLYKGDKYQIDKDLNIWVNSNYLIDMLKCLPNAKVYVVGQLSPIYFEADNGDGILLPVRPKE